MVREIRMMDGNEAAAYVAFRLNEVIAIYPITPSSGMGELSDAWAATGGRNLWGAVPLVQEMQSEGGVAGAVHGSLQAGSLCTTFTCSQGLLLMLPNMFKIAGELTSTVFHVAARSVATHALSIFGDHSDVMAARSTGWAMLCSGSVQEVMDFAFISQAAALDARVPFLHFFDGFRTSHEVARAEVLPEETMRALLPEELIRAHRERGLSPERPFVRGTAQNPDVFFQAREAANRFYRRTPEVVQRAMDRFAASTGRAYRLFEYEGAPDAERVIVMMGSGAETAHETVEALAARGEKVGLVKVRLYRPFDAERFLAALPATAKAVAVLDRTKEPGSLGEPLYLDVLAALAEERAAGGGRALAPRVTGGRYGLSSKEFSPAMVKAVFDELAREDPRPHFTVGIHDDVTGLSLEVDEGFSTESADTLRGLFYGLGADGTVGANRNSIKIIGEETPNHAQGYFVYDSKKSGSMTVSHLRFGPRRIRSAYLIRRASFVACHQWSFLERYDMLEDAEEGAVFLLNSAFGPEGTWAELPRRVQERIRAKRLRFFVIDAYQVAGEMGLGRRINTIMQVCFFAISGVLPREEAIAFIKASIEKTYGKRGEAVVKQNFAAVDAALAHLHEVAIPAEDAGSRGMRAPVPPEAPEFVQRVTAAIIAGRGDRLPVSAFPPDGTFPSGTARWERRNIAQEIPVWDPEICIQCGKCVLVCPHATIRAKLAEPRDLAAAPDALKSAPARWKEFRELRYLLQVAPEDCTGCSLCVQVCPVRNKSETRLKAINMRPQPPLRRVEAENWAFFLELPEADRGRLSEGTVKDVQLLQPLFEFSGACDGCGETPYVKLLSQLFGDRALVANATGCSSIYGGNLPTTPWSVNRAGRGPAWSNSLFEDNAEFGLGFRLALDSQRVYARELLERLRPEAGEPLVEALLNGEGTDHAALEAQRARVAELRRRLAGRDSREARDLLALADALVPKSVWIVGGDGWAYDIGYGGLDHVLASGRKVNILVLDTEVYSNTGGQMSKATPRGAVAKFAMGGKPLPKKDLGRLAMSYGTVYVAQVAMGANDAHTVKAFLEAEAHPGPSLIIAYSHCIAHGIDMTQGLSQQKLAMQTGYWPLFRFDPSRAAAGENPLQLDSPAPSLPLEKYMYNETRFRMLVHSDPAAAERLLAQAQEDVRRRHESYAAMAGAGAGAKEG